MKEKTFKRFTKDQIESVFDQLNLYGLELLMITVLAWEYNHEEDASILGDAYFDMYELKENDPNEEYRTPYSNRRGLKASLIKLENKEIEFLDELLDLDPNDVFVNNSYYDANDYEDVTVTSEQYIFRKYLEIAKLEKEKIEAAKKLLLTGYSDEAKKFNLRFKRSMNNKKTPGGFNPYSF